jgi:two-component system, NtrC family, response regulator AtoC
MHMTEGIAYSSLPTSAPALVGRSSLMARLKDLLMRAAASDIGVLLTGEMGSGKELAAREIHRMRARREPRGPFVIIDRADVSWPASIRPDVDGPLQFPRGCTLFIDELTELPPTMQAELLHALQRDSPSPAEPSRPVELRIVAATRRRPAELRNQAVLRSDLYFQVCEYIIEIPPLRDRIEDIRALVEHFLAELATSQRFSPEAYRALEACTWPGNVRELKAAIRRATLMHPEQQLLGVEQLFERTVPADRREGDLKHLLDHDWDHAKDEFGRWYWTNIWQNLGGDVHKVIEHTDVSQVWLRNRRKLYELRGGGA